MKNTTTMTGSLMTLGAFAIWGALPLYWKLMQALPAGVLLGYRILWAFVFTGLVILFRRNLTEMIALLRDKKKILPILAAAILISINWGLYIWAVNSGQVIEAALGYYINPLISVLLGVFFLKEKLNRAQIMALFIALGGVLVTVVGFGHVPWIALTLAAAFGLYGLIKKTIPAPALLTTNIETLFALPIAAFLLTFGGPADPALIGNAGWLLVVFAGPITAIPLLLFSSGARKIPLSHVGFIQYISPSITLVLGVFVFREEFPLIKEISFLMIWIALVIFSGDQFLQWKKRSTIANQQLNPGERTV